ncbi:protein kinase domain-containing protein [Myxococcus xanthus]|uniref:Protein kinase n=1 Tax=Myxococcus xanthus TaxID=34 RepID=A0A7Y4MUW1_MYXXA|nr:protein kinase [Myxococcus xanthus]NOJ82003.1 protein kinase [Myxococcus xanthus]NOJ89536.1 protein kinase [Myxococcus xanthus]
MQIGKYQLVRKLASGGMAEVFLAKAAGPRGFEKTLVLKRILPHLAEDAAFVEMFLGEARLAAQLEHPNIVQIFDFGEAEGSFFLAMEFIDGPNLRKLVKRAAEEALPPAFCAKVVAAAAEGLAYAHEFRDVETGEPLGLIHRDVSPDNILVSRQGAVKVVDFGIAKVAGQGHRTLTGVVKGKVAYMPPEQLQAKAMDRRVDVYALGVVLYELLTGKRPFDATTDVSVMQAILFESFIPVSARRPDVPLALQQVLDKALAKDRERRYADCRALQDDLERFVLSTGEPVGAYQIAQRIAQWVPEVAAAPATTPSQGGSKGAVASQANARSASMVSPAVDSTSPTTPMPRSLVAPVEVPADSTSPTTPMPIAIGGVVQALEPRSSPQQDTLQSYAVVVKTPALRADASARGASRPRAQSRALGAKVQAPQARDEDAVAMAAASPPPGGASPAPTTSEDADDAVHTRSTEYVATVPAGRPGGRIAVIVGGVVALLVGGAVTVMRGDDSEVSPVRVNPPPLTQLPSEPVAPSQGDRNVPQAKPAVDVKASAQDSSDRAQAKPQVSADVPVVPQEPSVERDATTPEAGPPTVKDAPSENGGAAAKEGSAVVAKREPAKASGEPVPNPSRARERAPTQKVAAVAKGRLEFRIRPYAVVSLDGKVLGQTPFAAVEVPEGRHTVRLVNKELGKDVTRTVDVKAGHATVFKLNLEAE